MNIRDHKLAWRWTDIKNTVLPSDVLAQLKPFGLFDAALIHQRSLEFLDQESLSQLYNQTQIKIDELSSSEVSSWLEIQQPILDAEVTLSWDPEAALKTTWAIFIKHWDEFCYPGSDDLVVFPSSNDWVLFYHHSEEFHFGKPSIDA